MTRFLETKFQDDVLEKIFMIMIAMASIDVSGECVNYILSIVDADDERKK